MSKLLDVTWAKGSLVAGNAVARFLRDLVGEVRIEGLKVPFIAVAVDINCGRGHLFDRGPMVGAIRASISKPGIFEPFAADGSYFVDGGVWLNLPLRALDQFRPSIRIGVGLSGAQWFNAEWTQGEIKHDHGPEKDLDRNLWQRVKDRFSGERDSEDDVDHDEPPDLPFLLARTFNTFNAEAERLEVQQTRPHLFINLDLSEIELWEFWRGVEAVELGYSQSQRPVAGVRESSQAIKLRLREQDLHLFHGYSMNMDGLLRNRFLTGAPRRRRAGGGGLFCLSPGFTPLRWTVRSTSHETYSTVLAAAHGRNPDPVGYCAIRGPGNPSSSAVYPNVT